MAYQGIIFFILI